MTGLRIGLGGAAVVVGLTAAAWAWGAREAGGFAYGLDDPYIHLAIAREFATRGEWGVGEGFVSGSSSPLWTAALALGLALGAPGLALPVVYNLVLVGLLGVLGARWLTRAGVGPGGALGTLVVLGMAAPLPALLVGGMEHVLQLLLLTLWFDALGARLAGEGRDRGLVVSAALLGLTRYESAFPVAVGLGLLAWRREWRLAAQVAGVAALGPALFGAWSMAQGGSPVPNPVLLKGAGEAAGGPGAMVKALVGWTWLTNAREPVIPLLPLLVAGALLVGPQGRGDRERATWTGLALLPAMLLHAAYARSGWFFRYEAWMVWVGGLYVAGVALPAWGRGGAPRVGLVAFALAGGLPLGFRAVASWQWIPEVVTSIRHQQVQTAGWLAAWPDPAPVAVNDVGAVAWYAPDRPIVDLVGLLDDEVALRKRGGPLDGADLDALARARGVGAAAIYDAWFPERPQAWVRVARWRIAEAGTCADRTVSFYATDPAHAEVMRASLDAWGLPPGVERLDPATSAAGP